MQSLALRFGLSLFILSRQCVFEVHCQFLDRARANLSLHKTSDVGYAVTKSVPEWVPGFISVQKNFVHGGKGPHREQRGHIKS